MSRGKFCYLSSSHYSSHISTDQEVLFNATGFPIDENMSEVIIELFQFLFIVFLIVGPVICVVWLFVKLGLIENRPGNLISTILSIMSGCLVCVKCKRDRSVEPEMV